MPLRAQKPAAIQKRLKAFFYGPAGVGKTTAAISFVAPYVVDTEKGCEHDQYAEIIENNGGAVFFTTAYDDLVKEIHALSTEKHNYKTLVIDSLTTIFNNLVDEAAIKVGTDFGRHYSEANKYMKNLFSLLLRLDMNVIITSHCKNEYGEKMEILGQTFDCYKKMDYLFDLVIYIEKRAKSRYGHIKKSRIKNFVEGSNFDFSYENIAKLYGKEILEKECVPEVWATDEQISQFKAFADILKVTDDQIARKLSKVEASELSEVPSSVMAEWIESLQKNLDKLKLAA